MDANQRKAMQGIIKETLSNLEENGFEAAYVNDKAELNTLIRTIIPEESLTASGGSETLVETGIMDFLRTKTKYTENRILAYSASFYLVSANAVTMHGELYEVDGRGNRVSAMLFGPEKVIVIAGINKIVTDLHAAVERVKTKTCWSRTLKNDSSHKNSISPSYMRRSTPPCDEHAAKESSITRKIETDKICLINYRIIIYYLYIRDTRDRYHKGKRLHP